MIADQVAKGTAAVVAALLVAVLGVLFVTSRPPAGARQVVAEFDNAFPLIEGMHVRVDGAIAGSVGEIVVNERGNAEVTLILHDSIEEPRGDASAAIRQQDTTGDSYVAFDPGGHDGDPRAVEPLGAEGIACSDHQSCPGTLVAPRIDDLLNSFGPAERAGVQLILVELAKALDRRGHDLNRAALELRPALAAANEALAEVSSQNVALERLIASAESVSGQAARRNRELDRLIGSLAATVETTAAEGDALDAGLERLPETARRARGTLASLAGAATRARPLAELVADGAPQLATALERLPGFLDEASRWIEATGPTLRLTRRLLRAALPTLIIGKERIVTGPFDLTGATADLLNSVLGGEDAFPALFGDDSYGEGGGTLDRAGFGAVAVEPGNLPGYPPEHAPRNWLRVSAVFNCEMFGRPVEPGCLADFLAGSTARRGGGKTNGRGGRAGEDEGRGRGRRGAGGGRGRGGGSGGPADGGSLRLPDPELPGGALDGLGKLRPPGGGPSDRPRRPRGPGGGGPALDGLLDFLLR